MLTVVICTCNRPEFLRDALDSLAAQNRIDLISKVIVSENGANRSSETVCREFPGLPIDYAFQDPPLPSLDHFASLRSRVETPWLAILHDDDWWLPDHIGLSIEALQQTEALACFANFAEAGSTLHPWISSYKAPRVWALSGFDFNRSFIHLSSVQNAAICLFDSSYHYSTCVVDANACWTVFDQVRSTGNAYDNDRTFPFLLGIANGVVYRPAISAVIRVHQGQDSLRSVYHRDGGAIKAQTTQWLQANFSDLIQQAATLFNQQVVPGLSQAELEGLYSTLPDEQRQALHDTCGFEGAKRHVASLPRTLERFTLDSVPLRRVIVFRMKCRIKELLTGLGMTS
jgi:glycosyltransferase involved in cell wall biosynthesis